MSVAWYIVLEREIPGFDHFVNGKALGRAGKVLDALAEEVGVQPLAKFFSVSPEELLGFAEDHGVDLKENAIKLPHEQWFSAEDGLQSVRALMQAAESGKIRHVDQILSDLKEFHKVLKVAKENGVGWHLAVDF
jgi:hypothetical protein